MSNAGKLNIAAMITQAGPPHFVSIRPSGTALAAYVRSAAIRRITSEVRSTSSSVVDQFDIDRRIAAMLCHVVPPSQHVPSRCTAAMIARVRASAASGESASS